MPMSRAAAQALDDFRIGSGAEIEALLGRLEAERTLVTLSSPDGHSFTTLLWNLDVPRRQLAFHAEGGGDTIAALLTSDEVVAVAYLDRIKLQFEVEGLMLVRGQRMDTLTARLPDEVFRFQRRSAYRVQPLSSQVPVAVFRHPAMPDMTLQLRVLDVSLSGAALHLPDDVPAIAPGVRINQCLLKLDADTHISTDLLIHHHTPLVPEGHGQRLGCELVGMQGQDRALQNYIHQTQKRRVVLAR